MRFLICIVFSLYYVYISELFPTVVRSLALGFLSVGGCVGGVLSTFIVNSSSSYNIHPMFIFGLISLISCVFIIPFKETLHQPLPNMIEEENHDS